MITFPLAVAVLGTLSLLFFFSGVAILALCKASGRKRAVVEHLENLRMEEKRKQYRKVIHTEPPGLIRIRELGWRQPCGHKMHEWDSDRLVCLQCVLEGRTAVKDRGQQ